MTGLLVFRPSSPLKSHARAAWRPRVVPRRSAPFRAQAAGVALGVAAAPLLGAGTEGLRRGAAGIGGTSAEGVAEGVEGLMEWVGGWDLLKE